MRFTRPSCPDCGKLANGTIETVWARACFIEPESISSSLVFEYSGETDVWWDTQQTVVNRGRVMLNCENEHNWFSEKEGGADG